MTPVKEMVAKVIANGQPGMALTDHGNMSGTFQMYKGLRKAGLLPFPGMEAYLVSDVSDKTAKRYHVTMFAFTTDGYHALVELTSASHQRDHYHYKPLVDMKMLQEMSDEGRFNGVVATTGCWFGWVQQAMEEHPDDPYTHMMRRAKRMAELFPHYYVEVQHHRQDGDDERVHALHRLAVNAGLPVIVTQDAHYCDAKEAKLHSLMKQLAYGGDPGDYTFPGDSYHLATTKWIRGHYIGDMDHVWADAQDTFTWLVDNHELKLPFLDTYQYHVPQISAKPSARLRSLVSAGLSAKFPNGKTPRAYLDRIGYELGIIDKLGMADYLLIVADYAQWCRKQDIFINARGSANGSLVCYLTGITEIDPIRWKTDFDRFMSLDRERPPDIDMDIERDRRHEVIEYLRTKYEICNIGTYLRLGVSEQQDGNSRGGIFVTFLSSERRRLGDDYKEVYGHVKGIADLRPIHGHEFVDNLLMLGDIQVLRSPGVHAAGYVLGTDDHPVDGVMPTMLIPSSGTIATQMTMDDVEDGGWIKLDLLGLATLTVVRQTMRMIGMQSWDEIPLDDKSVFALLRKGLTDTGIFQLEGWTAAKGCKEVGVKSVNDLILVNALYRPATINAGHKDTYLRNRFDRSRMQLPHAIFEDILKPTYGIPVYQEQVLDMLRALGFPTIELNKMLKAIKASNEKVHAAAQTFADLHALFIQRALDSGLTEEEAHDSWDFIATFTGYSFNKAHATAYGLLGYRTAWLKLHHPLEYHTALLRVWAGTDKEPMYIKEVRRMGIRLLPPDVNVSGPTWTLDAKRGAIRKGLVSIKGVGEKAAESISENRPFTSIEDLIERTNSRTVTGGKSYPKEMTGVIKKLYDAQALQSLMSKED
jgi:DNA polymerase-3 subunit alpha